MRPQWCFSGLVAFYILSFLQVSNLVAGRRHISHRNGATWTAWSDWSECSLSCGQGLRMRSRECVGSANGRAVRLPRRRCGHGRKQEHVMCQLRDCVAPVQDLREYQCASRNEKPMFGKKYQWKPFIEEANPCELKCQAIDFNFIYNFGKVLDGTPCPGDNTAICVNGICATPSCDGKIGSHAFINKCHVCESHVGNCIYHSGTYTMETPEDGYGYKTITNIPRGASYLKVHDNSTNYLALRYPNGAYVLNGDWQIGYPDTIDVNGTGVVYTREGDDETIMAEGPSTTALELIVMFRHRNPGIHYEYYISRQQSPDSRSSRIISTPEQVLQQPLSENVRERLSNGDRERSVSSGAARINLAVADQPDGHRVGYRDLRSDFQPRYRQPEENRYNRRRINTDRGTPSRSAWPPRNSRRDSISMRDPYRGGINTRRQPERNTNRHPVRHGRHKAPTALVNAADRQRYWATVSKSNAERHGVSRDIRKPRKTYASLVRERLRADARNNDDDDHNRPTQRREFGRPRVDGANKEATTPSPTLWTPDLRLWRRPTHAPITPHPRSRNHDSPRGTNSRSSAVLPRPQAPNQIAVESKQKPRRVNEPRTLHPTDRSDKSQLPGFATRRLLPVQINGRQPTADRGRVARPNYKQPVDISNREATNRRRLARPIGQSRHAVEWPRRVAPRRLQQPDSRRPQQPESQRPQQPESRRPQQPETRRPQQSAQGPRRPQQPETRRQEQPAPPGRWRSRQPAPKLRRPHQPPPDPRSHQPARKPRQRQPGPVRRPAPAPRIVQPNPNRWATRRRHRPIPSLKLQSDEEVPTVSSKQGVKVPPPARNNQINTPNGNQVPRRPFRPPIVRRLPPKRQEFSSPRPPLIPEAGHTPARPEHTPPTTTPTALTTTRPTPVHSKHRISNVIKATFRMEPKNPAKTLSRSGAGKTNFINNVHSRRPAFAHPKKKVDAKCKRCRNVGSRYKKYCSSDFAIHAKVTRMRYKGNGTRYELSVKQTYKSSLPLFEREFVWALDRCHCPDLEPRREYVIIGRLEANIYTRESRLIVDRNSFVRPYDSAEQKRFGKTRLAKVNCDKFKT